MVKRSLCDYMLLALGIAAISVVIKCNIFETTYSKNKKEIAQKQQNYSTEISVAELTDFIRLYPDFSNIFADSLQFVSMNAGSLPNQLGLKAKLWAVYHGCDINRFSYVEQRVYSLLNTLQMKNYAKGVIEQLSANKDDVSRQMIEKQTQILDDKTYGKKELDLIAEYEEKLKAVMSFEQFE